MTSRIAIRSTAHAILIAFKKHPSSPEGFPAAREYTFAAIRISGSRRRSSRLPELQPFRPGRRPRTSKPVGFRKRVGAQWTFGVRVWGDFEGISSRLSTSDHDSSPSERTKISLYCSPTTKLHCHQIWVGGSCVARLPALQARV